ncbi:hypothetical protein GCM10010124_16860 [Pilimelia terevasa]|uniref:DUF5753 domain-containing protein n=1 Tax=Pilimelia terevasa TaxID=53372 RepID=A0A8J3BNU2_9ACTN|nr:DUF5753 domain-containing protein [Pilimelia terevasa]GGK24945.1 hypothetical protein GCM10010124_16860 [Pilimelia terevasa]
MAELLTLEEAYALWKAKVRNGMKYAGGRDPLAIYEQTTVFRNFELSVLPGIFQVPSYTAAVVGYWRRFYGAPDDTHEVIKLRQRRAQAALRGTNRILVVLTEAVLLTRYTDVVRHELQLLELLKFMKRPNVSLGIIPFGREITPNSNCGFWIFDEDVVKVELPSAQLKITRPSEVEQYLRIFTDLQGQAAYGSEAKTVVLRAIASLS